MARLPLPALWPGFQAAAVVDTTQTLLVSWRVHLHNPDPAPGHQISAASSLALPVHPNYVNNTLGISHGRGHHLDPHAIVVINARLSESMPILKLTGKKAEGLVDDDFGL